MNISKCQRCGSCCIQSGPALHIQDLHLIEKNKLKTDNLICLRKNEKVWDNIQNKNINIEDEIIKIRSKDNYSECIFYNKEKKICNIYDFRPLECQILECWNTDKIKNIYKEQRLGRSDILPENLIPIISIHEQECSFEKLNPLVRNFILRRQQDDLNQIIDICRYDLHFRQTAADKLNLPPQQLDFIFGRLIFKVLAAYDSFFISEDFKNIFCQNLD